MHTLTYTGHGAYRTSRHTATYADRGPQSVYTVFLVAGPIVGGIAGGYIAFQQGWSYVFWVGTAITALAFACIVLLVPETQYQRALPSSSSLPVEAGNTAQDNKADVTELELSPPTQLPRSGGGSYRPYTFARSLGFARPSTWGHGVVYHFVQPWRTLALPGTWVVMLHYGGLVGGIVTISTLGPQLTAAPPYLWGANAGLINIGALIGSLIGAAYTYFVSDAKLKQDSSKDDFGLAEPESRLPTMFPALAIATGGFFAFGFSAQNPGGSVWVGLQFGYGMISFGLMQVPSIGFNYVSFFACPSSIG